VRYAYRQRPVWLVGGIAVAVYLTGSSDVEVTLPVSG